MAEPFTIPGTGLRRFVGPKETPRAAITRLIAAEQAVGARVKQAREDFLARPRLGGLAGASQVFVPPLVRIGDSPLLHGTKFIERVAGPQVASTVRQKLSAPGATVEDFTPQEQQLLIQGLDFSGRELDRQFIRSKQRSALSGVKGFVMLSTAGALLGATGAIRNISQGLLKLGGSTSSANAVPGASTGVTTPVGGGLTTAQASGKAAVAGSTAVQGGGTVATSSAPSLISRAVSAFQSPLGQVARTAVSIGTSLLGGAPTPKAPGIAPVEPVAPKVRAAGERARGRAIAGVLRRKTRTRFGGLLGGDLTLGIPVLFGVA